MTKSFEKRTQNYLVDSDIEALISAGELFKKGTFDTEQLSGCAYDLRAGASLSSRQRGRTVPLDESGYVIDAGEIVTVQTAEEVDFKSPLLVGLIVTSHTQLSQGLAHTTTVIDPGFVGPLAVTLMNFGTSGYRLKQGDRIAKLLISPIAPRPDRLYGEGYRPRVREGSLEHAQYLDKDQAADQIPLKELLGGRLQEIVDRIGALERDAELHRAKKTVSRYRTLATAGWVLVAGAVGGILSQKWDRILEWIGALLN